MMIFFLKVIITLLFYYLFIYSLIKYFKVIICLSFISKKYEVERERKSSKITTNCTFSNLKNSFFKKENINLNVYHTSVNIIVELENAT